MEVACISSQTWGDVHACRVAACRGGPDEVSPWAAEFLAGGAARPNAGQWVDFTRTSSEVTAEMGSQVGAIHAAGWELRGGERPLCVNGGETGSAPRRGGTQGASTPAVMELR